MMNTPICHTEFPISNRPSFIIGHSLFVIGYSTTQKSVALSRCLANAQYPTAYTSSLGVPCSLLDIQLLRKWVALSRCLANTQYPTAYTSSLGVPCSLLDIQLLKNRSRFHGELRTPNIQHGISNIQPPILYHWAFPVRYWIFNYSRIGRASTESFEHPISNRPSFIIGHSLFVIGHSLHWTVDLLNFPTHESRTIPALSKADLSAA